jgi:ABC-type multidrug transport system fused ATPase/permease subunit
VKIEIHSRFAEVRWRHLRRLAELFSPYVRDNRRLLVLAALCGIGAMLMRVLRPWPLKVIFDLVLIPTDEVMTGRPLAGLADIPEEALIGLSCLALLVISLLWGVFASRQTYLTARAGQHVVFELRRRVYSHLQKLSLGFHHRRKRGDLLMRLTGDINLLRDMLIDALLLGFSEILVLVAMITVMTLMSWRLTLVALVVLPIIALATFSSSVRIRDAARRQRKNEGRVAAMVSEMLSGVHLIQAFGRERHQEKEFRSGNRRSLKAGLRTTRLEAAMSRTVEVILATGTAGVLWFGVLEVKTGTLTPGDLLVFVSYLGSSYRPLRKLARISSRLSKAVVCGERVAEVLNSSPEIQDRPDAKRLRRVVGEIEFDRVDFSYAGGGRALRKASFRVEPGQFIGIVGPSGAGKSTLLSLVLRLYDPRRGKVRLDGRDVRRYRLQSLRDHMSVVLQEPLLFGSTIRENLCFGRPDADDEAMEACARLADAHSFIDELADGYATSMAEAGASLSIGQRQRLAIARAFLRDAPILLLDEPTNGLDATSEHQVDGALHRLMVDRTTLMVAHQLASVRDADRILVLRRGRIVESGAHETLMAQEGWYSRNFHLQSKRIRSAGRPRSNKTVQIADVVPIRATGAKP